MKNKYLSSLLNTLYQSNLCIFLVYPPDPVSDVTAVTTDDGSVTVSWTPPTYLGSASAIEQYLVQWGFMEYVAPGFASPELLQEGRVRVNGVRVRGSWE